MGDLNSSTNSNLLSQKVMPMKKEEHHFVRCVDGDLVAMCVVVCEFQQLNGNS